ncbi:MAG: putative DeoR family transcriptional regulator [Firmicutes bacterium]|nr:putative DeoR family transcriptional regulator [Bacillota bacterium]
MKTTKRRKDILEQLEKHKSVNITDLSEILDVSSMTIRRDLNLFAEQGIVTLVHGGAVLNRGAAIIHNMPFKEEILRVEKNRIASFCANLVNEGSSIFIDCGSTTKEIAETILQKKNIVVMTNSLPVSNILSTAKNIKLIMLPGVFREKNQGFFGQMTSEFVSNFKIDILFLGADGLDINQGATSPDIVDAETKRSLVKQATKVVLVIDHTKLGMSSFMTVATLKEIDTIVTDKDADSELIEELRNQGVEVFLV